MHPQLSSVTNTSRKAADSIRIVSDHNYLVVRIDIAGSIWLALVSSTGNSPLGLNTASMDFSAIRTLQIPIARGRWVEVVSAAYFHSRP